MSNDEFADKRSFGAVPVRAASGFADRDLDQAGAVSHALTSLCAIAGRISGAPTALIAQRNPLTSTIQVRGRIGTLMNEVDMSFVLPELSPDRQPIIIAPDIRHDRRFEDHPILRLMPHMKSLIALLVPGCDRERRAVLKVINPSKAAISDGYVHQMLSEVCVTAGDILKMERETPSMLMCNCQAPFLAAVNLYDGRAAQGLRDSGMREEASPYGSNDVATSFLFETLVRKRTLHSRNSVDYITLRSWRAALKKYQIAALASLKTAPPPQFVASIADEIVANVRRVHGVGGIRSVVPVPPGSSGRTTSLSVLLGHAVADRLQVSMHHALAPTAPAEIGSSSPRKSGRLLPYRLNEPVPGPILIVDDVASSGRHLELAVDACRMQSPSVHAIAWIGG